MRAFYRNLAIFTTGIAAGSGGLAAGIHDGTRLGERYEVQAASKLDCILELSETVQWAPAVPDVCVKPLHYNGVSLETLENNDLARKKHGHLQFKLPPADVVREDYAADMNEADFWRGRNAEGGMETALLLWGGILLGRRYYQRHVLDYRRV